MQERIAELGRKVTMFAAAAVIIGAAGVVMGVGDARDGEWTGIVALFVGVLGIAAGVLIWTGAGAGGILDGMNLGMLWALAHVPYMRYLNTESGIDREYPLPAFGAIFTVESSRTINDELVMNDVWGIGFMGVVLVVFAISARKDWTRLQLRKAAHGETRAA